MITHILVRNWLANYRTAVDASAHELNELDAAAGDGDFGASLQRGLGAVIEVLDRSETHSVGELLRLTGSTIVAAVGGTSGPLFGSLFLKAGTGLADATGCGDKEFAASLRVGAEAVMVLGGASLGDKTMVDALLPALDALDEALNRGEEFLFAAKHAAVAANDAAEATRNLSARRGRASYTGTAGQGHVDPGAQGIAILFDALAAATVPPESAT